MSLLTALAVLAAIGLLFAMDPGGAIADSGFPDSQDMGWKQIAAWGFRTIGVAVAQLLIIVLWLWPKYRPPVTSYSGTPRPGGMPAAAVSVLRGHMTWPPTLLASIIEMCQRGTLRIEPVGTRAGFVYRLSRQGLTEYEWERTICNSLRPGPTRVDALRERLDEREDAIGDQIGDYLQQRGLFHDNPVRVRREDSDDGGTWFLAASVLTGIGGGLWAALWLDAWWANTLIGASAGLVYSFVVVQMTMPRTGMLAPTPSGALEIGQWLAWGESMAGSAPPGARSQSDPMLPYAIGLNVAQPWLDVAAKAPPWFGSGSASPLRGADLDAAYRAFMHAPEWWLTGRSDDAAKTAAQWGDEEELRLRDQLDRLDQQSPDARQPERTAQLRTTEETHSTAREREVQGSFLEDVPPPSGQYQQHRVERPADEPKGGGCLSGCFQGCLIRVMGLVVVGVVALLVLFSLDVVSPRDKLCPLESPPIPTPAQIASAGDLFHDACVRIRGTIVSRDADGLVMEMDRGEYVQHVNVRDPSQALEAIPQGHVVTLAGRLRVHDGGTYSVDFVPDRGSDREWWRNLQENLAALF